MTINLHDYTIDGWNHDVCEHRGYYDVIYRRLIDGQRVCCAFVMPSDTLVDNGDYQQFMVYVRRVLSQRANDAPSWSYYAAYSRPA
jgi:hypothetical protein